jgi:SAM-dependent methyltransferase
MKIMNIDPPRVFIAGAGPTAEKISDCARIELASSEQITFITPNGSEYDVTRKSWGFYATPSMNSRLARHGLKSALIVNRIGRLFLMLVEIGKEDEFLEYLRRDSQKLLSWIYSDADGERLEKLFAGSEIKESAQAIRDDECHAKPGNRPPIFRLCPMCGGEGMLVHFVYREPPPGEFHYKFTEGFKYWRELHRCPQCGHYLEYHQMNQETFYTGDYVSATYGDQEKIKSAFDRIISLPADKSDNEGRARRILNFAQEYFPAGRFDTIPPRLLDVGSGLCVFGQRMKKAKWDVTAIDMDKRLVEHARNVVGVKSMLADVKSVEGIGAFDLISFNKVLEHIDDPISMLASVRRLLKDNGFIYIELPDGENAEAEGQNREEFLLGHIHVFSAASMALLVKKAGFDLVVMERLREPSTKYTLRAFIKKF